MPEPEPRRTRRSVSQFGAYADCQERYRLERIAKAPQRPAAWLHHGVAVHEAIEAYERDGRTHTADQLKEIFVTEYRSRIERTKLEWPDMDSWLVGGRKKTEADIEDREVQGQLQIDDYLRYAEEHATEWRIVATEVEFTIDLGGVEVFGYIDAIRQYADGSLAVVDLKSGSSVPGSAMQLGVYSHAVAEYMGVLPTRGIFVKLARPASGSAKAKPTTELEHDLTPWTRDLLGRMFHDMDRSEAKSIFIPNPQDGCQRFCAAAQYCTVPGKGHMESAAQFSTIRTREDYFAAQQLEAA